MRARGRDITELFGYAPDDVSANAVASWVNQLCPFSGARCSKYNHDQTVIYGTCSISNGIQKTAGSEVIICPQRIYAEKYKVLTEIAKQVWPGVPNFFIGGSANLLRTKVDSVESSIVAYGHGSVAEIQIESNGTLSFDWILQRFVKEPGTRRAVAKDFVVVEVQSIDTTGNYRDNWAAYGGIKSGNKIRQVPDSGHGLNWANVHKRLIPQLIRKGNLANKCDNCSGFFFVVPESVYEKFEQVIGELDAQESHGMQSNLSVLPVSLGPTGLPGSIRPLRLHAVRHYNLNDLALAFIGNVGPSAADELKSALLRAI